MKDVTTIMERYRECVRHIWNTYLRTGNSTPDDKVNRFDRIKELLFSEIVLRELGKPNYRREDCQQELTFLRVVPVCEGVPIMVNRPSSDGNKYWDDPVDNAGPDADLRFIDFFDWDQLGFMNLQFYHVKIFHFPKFPHLVGREALLDTQYARVFLDESSDD